MKAVITVVGKDTVGVVSQVSRVLSELNINIEDITQSIMQHMFCMIMLVDLSGCTSDMGAVRSRLETLAGDTHMEINLIRQEVFDAMHHI